MSVIPAGFREVAHTADWELKIWGPDLSALLEQAARGMYTLSGIAVDRERLIEQELHVEGLDGESLLVAFLNELLYLAENEALAFERFEFILTDFNLHARMTGGKILSQSKEVKAVTYHNLEIQPGADGNGLTANIVLDV
ncbi:MAG TPA: archease [Anaerolineales bacterium]|nr:archease [Anaerolineales bacterium]